jgi:hypothetical protein
MNINPDRGLLRLQRCRLFNNDLEARMKPLITLASIFLLAGCVGAPASAGLVDVSVYNRNTGEELRTYRHRGRLYVVGTPGDKYAIAVRNEDSRRVLTVVSVDGVNVVTGETASPKQGGYVLSPRERTEINGWRKRFDEVAAFVFTSLPDSYAARTGRPDHIGVIGLAVFREKVIRPKHKLSEPRASTLSAANAGAAAKSLREERLGTGHGAREHSYARYTEFQRASKRPVQVIKIYYDSYNNLVARGVIPHKHA